MPMLPIPHFQWQVLRAAKRSPQPLTGQVLRLTPSRRTKDGTFLTELVRIGALAYATGDGREPFAATYALTPLGEHAAEYGKCEIAIELLDKPEPPAKPKPKGGARRGRGRPPAVSP